MFKKIRLVEVLEVSNASKASFNSWFRLKETMNLFLAIERKNRSSKSTRENLENIFKRVRKKNGFLSIGELERAGAKSVSLDKKTGGYGNALIDVRLASAFLNRVCPEYVLLQVNSMQDFSYWFNNLKEVKK
ncbi:hypothetical protein [Flammeovirga agarivorans]|uniref:Uncharacterized protein n=1 Tax=Flammeovirga agarivorans TaxID=2726742 RepID=A0A7X8SR91_9BACT|nr:hypothetical protein [Flammeovirga agarivorans]NLR94918.1 hypothetical protein [Flammeovirga agarivorans]